MQENQMMMENKIKTLIVPTDFSEKSENALRLAVQMSKRHHAKIILVHVAEMYHLTDRTGRQIVGADTVQQNIDSGIQQLTLTKNRVLEDNTGLHIQTSLKTGNLVDSINDLIVSEDADMVIIGTSGQQNLKKLLLGSCSYSVLCNVNCSVLLVPMSFTKNDFSKILFPVRVTENLDSKLDLALAIANKNNSVINLYGVCDEHNLPQLRQEFLLLKNKLKEKMKSFKSELVFAYDKADAISKVSREENSDILILNGKDELQWKSIFAENFFKKIINETDVALLFMKPKTQKSAEENTDTHHYDISLPIPG
ncbi:universal stress protein [Chryseobacterium sp.]|uniref:universal stress protein n=1 Tax=Chryseobacterium sp. TaxID=1871047 RepID=UPI001628E222|nr:universal stress protein [Chryseobacterium sp.]